MLNGIPISFVHNPVVNSKDQYRPDLRWAIHACASTNEEAAKELIYRQMYGYVAAVVSRYIKNTYDMEELVNESFIKGFKAIHTFSYSEKDEEKVEKLFYGWMGRIASNLSIDHLRSKKHFQAQDDWAEEELKLISVSASDALEVQDILKLLDQLPAIQRTIFNLYEVEGYSHDEISKQLEIPESTSRTYLTRGKQKLRMLYNKLMETSKKDI